MRAASKFTRGGAVALFAFASAAGLTRCSLFVDTDGLSGGDSGATLLDGSTSDVVISREASADASSAGDGAIATEAGFPGCDGGHLICETFDDGVNVISANWTDGTLYGGGVLELVSDASVTSPNSLHSVAPANGAGAGAAVYRTLSIASTHVHCELDTLVRSAGDQQVIQITYAGARSTDQDYFVDVNLGAVGGHVGRAREFFDGGGQYGDTPLANIGIDQWTHVSIDVAPDVDAGLAAFAVAINGGNPVRRDLDAPIGITLAEILLGENYSQVGFEALYDNVVCDVNND